MIKPNNHSIFPEFELDIYPFQIENITL